MTVESIARDAWNDALTAFPARSVFHRLEWLELLSSVHGASLDLAGLRRDGSLVALLPTLTVRKGPLKASGSPLPGWSSAYLGPIGATAADATAMVAAAQGVAPLSASSYTELRTAVHEDGAVDLRSVGYEQTLAFETYLLALGREEDDLFAGLTSKCRNTVRKGTKNGYEIREETSADFIDDFWRQSEAVFLRWGLAPGYTEAFLREMWTRLHPAGLLDVRSAFHEGERAATIVILDDGQTAYYWAGATDEAHRKGAPNNLLLWECIRAANERGCAKFDFVSSSGQAGKFKKSFGPEPVVSAHTWARSRTRVEGLLKKGYEEFLRRRRRTDGGDDE